MKQSHTAVAKRRRSSFATGKKRKWWMNMRGMMHHVYAWYPWMSTWKSRHVRQRSRLRARDVVHGFPLLASSVRDGTGQSVTTLNHAATLALWIVKALKVESEVGCCCCYYYPYLTFQLRPIATKKETPSLFKINRTEQNRAEQDKNKQDDFLRQLCTVWDFRKNVK